VVDVGSEEIIRSIVVTDLSDVVIPLLCISSSFSSIHCDNILPFLLASQHPQSPCLELKSPTKTKFLETRINSDINLMGGEYTEATTNVLNL
jgi:hypothetical protein